MKKAFLVGINKYPDAPLNGCVNDCLLMYKVLSEKFGFENNNIDIITDQQCTRENIIIGLKKLTSNLNSNDTIFFHYSGHGSQVVVNDWTKTPEADGRDEIICPVDMDWNNPLRDHDLKNIFIQIPKGVKSTIVLDSCHSGTGLRGNNPTSSIIKNRFLPPPISNILSNPKITLDDNLDCVFPEENTKDIQTKRNRFLISTIEQNDNILISGCKDNQTSADAFLNNRYHGALTFALVEILKQKQFKCNYQELIVFINDLLKRSNFQQEPQLECKKELFTNLFAS